MITVLIAGIGLFIAGVIVFSVVFAIALAYGYWFLSVGTAPLIWAVIAAAVALGLITGVKNAIKAAGTVYFPGGKRS